MEAFVPVITTALNLLSSIMGGRSSRPAPAVDVQAVINSHQAAMQQRENAFNAQRQEDMANFERRLQESQNSSNEQRQRMMEEFQREQERAERDRQTERERYEERLNALAQSIQDAESHARELAEQLERPVKDRAAKIAFVNGLSLKIHQNDSLLLLGPKGMGKSTFLWLLNKGEMPKRTTRDGTVEIIQVNGFVDSIGLRGWTPEELLKLLVLMIYDGIPKDLIIFGNDRIDLPVTSLGLLGINNPMIVIMSSDFWKNYQPPNNGKKRINLVETESGVRRVQPVEDLDLVYNIPVYEEINEFHLGTPITHHDNLDLLVSKRENAGVRPFQFLMDNLGSQFNIKMDNDYNMEALFRFIYIYEKKYERNRLRFMNYAKLEDFA